MSGPLRHDERDAPRLGRRPGRMGCPVRRDHVSLALASLRIGLNAMVTDKRLGVGLRQPFGLPAASEPFLRRRPAKRIGRYRKASLKR